MEFNDISKVINAEVIGCFTSADVTKIKRDKINFSKDFIEKTLRRNHSLKSFFENYNT